VSHPAVRERHRPERSTPRPITGVLRNWTVQPGEITDLGTRSVRPSICDAGTYRPKQARRRALLRGVVNAPSGGATRKGQARARATFLPSSSPRSVTSPRLTSHTRSASGCLKEAEEPGHQAGSAPTAGTKRRPGRTSTAGTPALPDQWSRPMGGRAAIIGSSFSNLPAPMAPPGSPRPSKNSRLARV